MRLRIRDIDETTKELEFDEPGEELNRLCSAGPVQDYRVEGPVHVVISFYRAGSTLFFHGEVSSQLYGICARCLEELRLNLDCPLDLIFAPRGTDVDLEEQPAVDLYDGEEIDIMPRVNEEILLALPMQALCGDGCRGLCSDCGANLNVTTCSCGRSHGGSGLTVLKNLKVH